MALTKLVCEQAKPKEKAYTLADGDGLSLEVAPNGSKYWIVRYNQNGKPCRKSLGVYPRLSIKEAREKNFQLRKDLDNGAEVVVEKAETFGGIADEWFARKVEPVKAAATIKMIKSRLHCHILPALSDKTLKEINPSVVLSLCQRLEDEGKSATAHKVKTLTGQIFRYAIATSRTDYDPTFALMGALRSMQSTNLPALTKTPDIARLMRAIDAHPVPVIRDALNFHALVFLRPSETLHTSWDEIDFKEAQINIPAPRMKMRREHVVPLARQTLELLKSLKSASKSKWLFPRPFDADRPIDIDMLRYEFRKTGIDASEMSLHGFRAMASTVLNERQIFSREVIERQLAHQERNKVMGAYNRAEYLPQRRELMQWWADWLDNV
jgi:integrase